MKAPKKLIITIVIATSIVGCGVVGLNIFNSGNSAQVSSMLEQEVKVEKGDLELNIVSSGNIALANKDNPDFNNLKVQINVDQTDINKLKIGQLVNLKVDALPNETIKGTISSIASTSEEDSTKYKVDIDIEKSLYEVGTINSDDVNLREGASNQYLSVKQLNKDTKVKILKLENSWYKVALEDGTMGWIYKNNIKLDGLNRNDIEGTINENVVNLNKIASSKASLITKLVKGNKVTILDKNNGYYKVKLSDGQEGWVKQNTVVTEDIKPGMSVTASISIDSKKDVMYLPVECLVKNSEGYFVMLPGSNETRYIKVGMSNEDYVEIISGLSAGDSVVSQTN